MRGLDTNVLVRYITADDAIQAAVVEKLMEQSSLAGQPLFIPLVVLCELVWVLSRSHGQVKAEIIQVLANILETRLFEVESDSLVRRSLDAFRSGKGDFADYLIGEMCLKAGCEDCVTFDRGLKGAAGFTLLH
ncbi:MAG: type II toxin-antitoxin system VapC family toxin [Bryobacteraceae bacterium]|jgi:predicted nucleic-acid-binding protein